jgi:hypothetical protein
MQPITYKWDKRVWYCETEDPTLKLATNTANVFTVGEVVTGETQEGSAGAEGLVKSVSGNTITFREHTDGIWAAGETITGSESGAQAVVAASDFYDDGGVTPADILAVTPDGTEKKDSLNVGFLSQDILAIEQANGYGSDNDTSLIVDLTRDGTSYGLKYERLVPILVSAIKELSAKVEALENA